MQLPGPHSRRFGAALLLLLAPFARAQETVTPALRVKTFNFTTNYDSSRQIPACAQVTVNYSPLDGASPSAPYSVLVYPDGYRAAVYSARGDASSSFSMDYPEGTTVWLGMRDSSQTSGGALGPYTVVASTGDTCNYHVQGGDNVTFTSSIAQGGYSCGEGLPVQVSGGTNPYLVALVAIAPSEPGQGTATANAGVSDFNINVNGIIASGGQYLIYTYDSVGYRSPCAIWTNGLGTSNCPSTTSSSAISSTYPGGSASAGNSATSQGTTSSQSTGTAGALATGQSVVTTASKTNVGAIVGGVVGGVVLLFLLLLLAFCLRRRRRRNVQKEKNVQEQHDDQPVEGHNLPDHHPLPVSWDEETKAVSGASHSGLMRRETGNYAEDGGLQHRE